MRTVPDTSSSARSPGSDPPTEPPTDAVLLAGTRTDFGTVFDRHAGEIYRYCARRVGTEAVDDAVSDTFAIAYERRGRFDPAQPSALPWLYGIATNVLRRYRATEARYRKLIRHGETAAEGAAERAVARADADTAVRALAGELDKISRRQRDVLSLYAAGLTYADIATALDIPIGTVMSRLNRARTRLRAALLELGITTLEGPA